MPPPAMRMSKWFMRGEDSGMAGIAGRPAFFAIRQNPTKTPDNSQKNLWRLPYLCPLLFARTTTHAKHEAISPPISLSDLLLLRRRAAGPETRYRSRQRIRQGNDAADQLRHGAARGHAARRDD